jgi:hypothetical protein
MINKALDLPFDEPQETYSSSEHFFHDMGIPPGTKGRLIPEGQVVIPRRDDRGPRSGGGNRSGGRSQGGGRGDGGGRGEGNRSGGSRSRTPQGETASASTEGEKPARKRSRNRRRTRGGGQSASPAAE